MERNSTRDGNEKRHRLILADDHEIVTEGLRSLLEDEFEVVDTVTDGKQLVKAVRRLNPDIVVTDIEMPRLNGLAAVRRLRRSGYATKVIFLSMYWDAKLVSRAREVGALGYIFKHQPFSELAAVIRKAVTGGASMTLMFPAFEDNHDLTPRQREVLRLLCEHRSPTKIAEILRISPRTVDSLVQCMMEELELGTEAELIDYAIEQGIDGG